MNSNEYLIVLLIVEGCIVLIAILIYCLMERRRKRKREDVETGSSNDVTKRQKMSAGSSHAGTDVSELGDKRFPFKPKGIPNVGASCFMNSMLQCLSWSPCLIKQLEHQIEKMQQKQYQGKLATTFLRLLQLNHAGDEDTAKAYKKKQTKNVKMFCKELVKEKEHFDGRSQEDSFEFYNALISGLEDEALRNVPFWPKKEPVTEMEHIMQTCDVTRLFGGMFMTCYCYKECGHVEPVFQRFTSLSIPPVVKKKTEDDKPKPTFAKKRPGPLETIAFSVKPKKRQPSTRHVEVDSVSKSVDVSATREPYSGQSKRIVDETTRIVSNQDHQMKTPKGYGAIQKSQKMDGNRKRKHNTTSMPKSTSNLTESSDNTTENSIDMSSLREHLPIVEELGLKTENKKGDVVVGNNDDTNDTDGSTSKSDIGKVTPNSDDQESLSDCSIEDINRLQGLCLVKRKNKLKKKRTGIELSLDKLTDFEKMMAADLPCRICSKKKETCGGVLYKQIQLVSLPHVLVLHINRFEQKGSQFCKVTDFVSYPKFLDMTKFCSKSLEQLESDSELLHGHFYSLFGVVNHQGSMRGGHYYAYIKTNHRDVRHIQNQLQNSWKDPEAMASGIRTQLEAIWKAEREICVPPDKKQQQEDKEDVDSQNSQTSNDVQKKKKDGCRKDGSLCHNNDQQDSVDQNRRPKKNVTFDNEDSEQDILSEGNKTDLQKDPDLQRCKKKIKSRNNEDKESCALQKEDGTAGCQTGQNGYVLEEIIHNNYHDEVKDSDNQEDMKDPVRTKSPISVVHGEDTNVPSRQKRSTNDVQEEDMTSPDRKKKRKDVVQEEVKNDPDRKQEHKDTDRELDMNDPVREKEHKKVALGEDINDVGLKKNETKDVVREEDMNDPGMKEEIKDEIRKEEKHEPDIGKDVKPLGRSKEQKKTVCQESMHAPGQKKEHKAKNDNDAGDVNDNQIDKKVHLKGFINKGENGDRFKGKDAKDPDQSTGEQDAGQKTMEHNAVMMTKDEKDAQKRKENDTIQRKEDRDCFKTKRDEKMKKKGKKGAYKDDRERPLQPNEKQDEEQGDHIPIYEHNSDAVNRKKIPTNWEDRGDNKGPKTDAHDMWFYVSDSRVQKEEERTVFTSTAAYILLYERI
ncbi:uncharacterized protein LOC110446768 isoform X2 [Mizuhopecten yessoensis]|uniref:ubiquitinyl hydrolase 1 n=1 Tax=Mizuhopecten yessoensis TaxID=6573 RepID=A0A210QWV1_MIZYE|nr:uncharacterized protein LOC110446768 isoform X2 [Mizuhopecten yessoensis]OWF53152.1 Ubiquitin carboxyl-terminal hydrolase 45 [Mizuhopecten yessoensis]